jgi:16S rRNA (uracil1498-N3)-methyltransferase
MQLPFFYIDPGAAKGSGIELDEENSRHVIQVLRMKTGESLHLTDGKGQFLTARIVSDNKKRCRVEVQNREFSSPSERQVVIGISLLKNTSRFEWFLEKATEIGISRIIPLICKRTEKEKFRQERLKGICISAMLQSRQAWLPVLDEAVYFEKILGSLEAEKKFIGYCDTSVERTSLATLAPFNNACILIGPEGDFTSEEFQLASRLGFQPVSLGETRLRTETAGIVSAVLLMNA